MKGPVRTRIPAGVGKAGYKQVLARLYGKFLATMDTAITQPAFRNVPGIFPRCLDVTRGLYSNPFVLIEDADPGEAMKRTNVFAASTCLLFATMPALNNV